MASLDSLPPDQRAVLQLVLQRNRSYDDIAALLSIDRAAVRERALAAFDALGPGTRVPAEQRALITDYLLGQLPDRVASDVYTRLADSPSERAWARVVASELGSLVSGPLPEIPVESVAREPEPPGAEPEAEPEAEPLAAAPGPEPAAAPRERRQRAPRVPRQPRPPKPPKPPKSPKDAKPARPVSRRGGAILLGGGTILIIVIVIAVISLASGDSTKKQTSSTAASASTSTSPTTTSTATTSTGSVRPIAQVNLTSPTGSSKTKGAAVIIKQGNTTAIEIVAQGVAPNTTHDAYAVWLFNSSSDNHLLGFVNPGIKKNGVLRTLGPLPANASHFKQLLVTRETQAKPHGPGTIVLQGSLSLPSS
jgi:sigma-70-like protein